MRSWHLAAIGVLALVGGRFARGAAQAQRSRDIVEEPYAPSPSAAPIVALGYREAAADALWIRFLGYWTSDDSTAEGIAAVVDAIIALDPQYQRIYETGARAITMASHGVTQDMYKHAIAILEAGMKRFDDDYKMPELASEIYTQDLKTDDPKQRRAWDEKGTLLMEAAIRKPGAPAWAATWAAYMRTRLGERQEAIRNLREMILLTSDLDARDKMIQKLAKLEDADSTALQAELVEERRKFEDRWQHDRPDLPATIYVLLGPRLHPGFDMTDLATGGRDLFGSQQQPEATAGSSTSSP